MVRASMVRQVPVRLVVPVVPRREAVRVARLAATALLACRVAVPSTAMVVVEEAVEASVAVAASVVGPVVVVEVVARHRVATVAASAAMDAPSWNGFHHAGHSWATKRTCRSLLWFPLVLPGFGSHSSERALAVAVALVEAALPRRVAVVVAVARLTVSSSPSPPWDRSIRSPLALAVAVVLAAKRLLGLVAMALRQHSLLVRCRCLLVLALVVLLPFLVRAVLRAGPVVRVLRLELPRQPTVELLVQRRLQVRPELSLA